MIGTDRLRCLRTQSRKFSGATHRLNGSILLTYVHYFRISRMKATSRRLKLSDELNLLCSNMLSKKLSLIRFTEKLQSLRNAFRRYLQNKRAEYYDAFK